MSEFLEFSISDFLHHIEEIFTQQWFDSVHDQFELSNEDIAQSVHEASVFFNIDDPATIREDWTTGVMTNSPFTHSDDVLVFNKGQMIEMGITDKMGFDLVMTHEAGHRALSGLNTGFNSHQEELCCDFMAGVRAGLQGLDEGKMEKALGHTYDSTTHPDGVDRVASIEKGVSFAQSYMDSHNGKAPSFADCLDYFNDTRVCQNAAMHAIVDVDDPAGGGERSTFEQPESQTQEQGRGENGLDKNSEDPNVIHQIFGEDSANCDMNNTESSHADSSFSNNSSHEGDDISFRGASINDREWHLKQAEKAKENAEWHEKKAEEAMKRGDLTSAQSHTTSANICWKDYRKHIDSASRCTQ